jgi:hypothetical protein
MSIVGNMKMELCDCGKEAVWCYLPGYGDGSSPYSCDDCVNRSCDCNHRYVSPDAYHPPLDHPDLPTEEDGVEGVDWGWVDGTKEAWQWIDEKGRPYPCCEYHHEPHGFDVYEED